MEALDTHPPNPAHFFEDPYFERWPAFTGNISAEDDLRVVYACGELNVAARDDFVQRG